MSHDHASGEEGEMWAWKLLAAALYICKLQSGGGIKVPVAQSYIGYDDYDPYY